MNPNFEHLLALGVLGAAAVGFVLKGDTVNAVWALGILAGYAFKNGATKH